MIPRPRTFHDRWRFACPECRKLTYYYRTTTRDYKCENPRCGATFQHPIDMKAVYAEEQA